jgi:DNA-binding transcriptional regulator YiaG
MSVGAKVVADWYGGALLSALAERVRADRRLPAPGVCRAIREAAGVSQQQLADELGVDRVTIARWELSLRSPRGELRRRYTDLLEELQALPAGAR